VKTLVCIDGRERALTAVRLAARLLRAKDDEATQKAAPMVRDESLLPFALRILEKGFLCYIFVRVIIESQGCWHEHRKEGKDG